MPRDDSSVITIGATTASSSKPKTLSRAKLEQLERARAKSLESRRKAQKAKLEGKLNHLRSMLGSDLRPDTVERVAKEMMAQEERHQNEIARLREKHVLASQELSESLTGCKDELRSLRKSLAPSSHAQHTTTLKEIARKPPASTVSSAVSRRS